MKMARRDASGTPDLVPALGQPSRRPTELLPARAMRNENGPGRQLARSDVCQCRTGAEMLEMYSTHRTTAGPPQSMCCRRCAAGRGAKVNNMVEHPTMRNPAVRILPVHHHQRRILAVGRWRRRQLRLGCLAVPGPAEPAPVPRTPVAKRGGSLQQRLPPSVQHAHKLRTAFPHSPGRRD